MDRHRAIAAQGVAAGAFSNDHKASRNWKAKADERNKKAKKDLAVMVKKAITEGVKKASEKKRKASDKELDLNAIDLKGFNYEEMENLCWGAHYFYLTEVCNPLLHLISFS
jgi:hypothetical protein